MYLYFNDVSNKRARGCTQQLYLTLEAGSNWTGVLAGAGAEKQKSNSVLETATRNLAGPSQSRPGAGLAGSWEQLAMRPTSYWGPGQGRGHWTSEKLQAEQVRSSSLMPLMLSWCHGMLYYLVLSSLGATSNPWTLGQSLVHQWIG